MKSLATLALLILPLTAFGQCAGGVASAAYPVAAPAVSYDVQTLCQQAVATCVPTAAALPAYAPPVVQAVPTVSYQSVVQQVPVQTYAAPVLAAPTYYAAPVVRSFAVPAYSYQRSFAVRSFAVPYAAAPVIRQQNVFIGQQRGFAGGFGGQPGFFAQVRQNVAQGAATGGLLGAAERLVGVGDGSGQLATGLLLGRFLPGGGGFRFKR